MNRALSILTAVTAFATFPLYAEDGSATKTYEMRQGGEWPRSWPEELDRFRSLSSEGLRSWTLQRSGEPLVHYGIKFLTREEFEAAWPHLLKVKSKGAPIILRSGLSHWLGGALHGVCVHTPSVGKQPLGAQELKRSPWKTKNYIELIVDGEIVDVDRISLPKEAPIIDKRVQDTRWRENGDVPSVAQQIAATQEVADNVTTGKPTSRKLRDFAPDDPVLSYYEHLYVELTDPAKAKAVKKELAKYARVIEDDIYSRGRLSANVYDDVDTDAARAALAQVDGAGETVVSKRGRYDKRTPDLKATLKIGTNSYAVDQTDGLELMFFLTNTSKRETREIRSIDSNLCHLDLRLDGPGSMSDRTTKTHESTIVLPGKVIRLKPSSSYRIPVTSLLYGAEYSLHQWRWIEPGEYTLTVAYKIGEVRYEAPAVKLTVIDK